MRFPQINRRTRNSGLLLFNPSLSSSASSYSHPTAISFTTTHDLIRLLLILLLLCSQLVFLCLVFSFLSALFQVRLPLLHSAPAHPAHSYGWLENCSSRRRWCRKDCSGSTGAHLRPLLHTLSLIRRAV